MIPRWFAHASSGGQTWRAHYGRFPQWARDRFGLFNIKSNADWGTLKSRSWYKEIWWRILLWKRIEPEEMHELLRRGFHFERGGIDLMPFERLRDLIRNLISTPGEGVRRRRGLLRRWWWLRRRHAGVCTECGYRSLAWHCGWCTWGLAQHVPHAPPHVHRHVYVPPNLALPALLPLQQYLLILHADGNLNLFADSLEPIIWCLRNESPYRSNAMVEKLKLSPNSTSSFITKLHLLL